AANGDRSLPANLASSLPPGSSHTRTVRSADADASRLPSAEQEREAIAPPWRRVVPPNRRTAPAGSPVVWAGSAGSAGGGPEGGRGGSAAGRGVAGGGVLTCGGTGVDPADRKSVVEGKGGGWGGRVRDGVT